MSIINNTLKVILHIPALPFAFSKDLIENCTWKKIYPSTINVLDGLFDTLEELFSSIESTIDNIL